MPTSEVPRGDVPKAGGERETLRAYLDFHRATLARACAGLTDDELRRRATPSSLSLLALVRHMAEVEHAWWRRVLDGQDEVTGVGRRSGEEYSLRRVLVHLVQEYARHNGHADLLREGIDGAPGV